MEEIVLDKNKKLFKRDLKKGKIFAIHHVTRRIHLLRKKVGTEQQVEKNMRKADRLQKEIDFIKDFDVDIVLEKLQSKPDLFENAVNMDGLKDIEDRAFARLISSKPIKNRLKNMNNAAHKDLENKEISRKQKDDKNVSSSLAAKRRPKAPSSTVLLTQTTVYSDEELVLSDNSNDDKVELKQTATSLFVKSMASLTKDRFENTSKKKRNSQKKTPKKSSNRLGQRTRQRLWQEKYGKNANHMKIKKKELQKSKFDNQKIKPNKGLKPKQITQETTSHPSWEASKKRKLQQNISQTQFQGKKIVFDD